MYSSTCPPPVRPPTAAGGGDPRAGNVVLAAKLVSTHEAGQPDAAQLLCPLNSFSSNATWGVADWPPPEAGSAIVIRRQLNHADYTNLAWAAAVSVGRAPRDRLANRWLNYYGPSGTLPRAYQPPSRVGNQFRTTGFFAGKAVLIGGPI